MDYFCLRFRDKLIEITSFPVSKRMLSKNGENNSINHNSIDKALKILSHRYIFIHVVPIAANELLI